MKTRLTCCSVLGSRWKVLPIHNQFIHQKAADLYSTMSMLSGVGQITSHPFPGCYQDIARNYATVCIM